MLYYAHCFFYRLLGEGIDIAFVPLGDHSGTVQLTCDSRKWANLIESLRTETVIMARGVVKSRPEKDRNPSMHTGMVTIAVVIMMPCVRWCGSGGGVFGSPQRNISQASLPTIHKRTGCKLLFFLTVQTIRL